MPKCNRQLGYSMISKCPITCGGEMEQTNWLPGEGFDQRLREFKCKYCGEKQYYRLPESSQPVEAGVM